MSTTVTIATEAYASAEPPRLSVKPEGPIHTIDELIRHRAYEMGDSPLIGYPKEALLDYEEHSARAVDRYVDAAAYKLQELGLQPAVSIQRHRSEFS